ncbi:MOB kinase activator 3A isoform X1 [Bos taurus]|uniref:MOB kinase activator 3A isoform X1 n=1 Tax=Bos taurus TaxID=9913 RepID=UPI0028CB9ED4|nr:MOB kinase activator 3A isoform X1 [Bos taurus]
MARPRPPPPAADQPTAPPAPLPRPPRTNQRRPRATPLRRAPTNGALSGGPRPCPARGVGLAPVTGNRGRRFLLQAPPRSGHSKRKLHPFVGPTPRPRLTHAPTAIAKLLLPGGLPGSRPRLLLPAHSKFRPQASPALVSGEALPWSGSISGEGRGGRVRNYSGPDNEAGLASGPGTGSSGELDPTLPAAGGKWQEDPGEPLMLDSEKPLLVFPLLPLEVF